jgi:hypothetical protein
MKRSASYNRGAVRDLLRLRAERLGPAGHAREPVQSAVAQRRTAAAVSKVRVNGGPGPAKVLRPVQGIVCRSMCLDSAGDLPVEQPTQLGLLIPTPS